MADVNISRGGSGFVACSFHGGPGSGWFLTGEGIMAINTQPNGWNCSSFSTSGCIVSVPSSVPLGVYSVEYWFMNVNYGGGEFEVTVQIQPVMAQVHAAQAIVVIHSKVSN